MNGIRFHRKTWEDGIPLIPHDELAKRVTMALRLNYDCQRDSTAMYNLDNILNGRWFALPKRYGGEKP